MKKIIIAALTAISFMGSAAATAEARPYLHYAEATCALQGCYGSDNDVYNTKVQLGYTSFGGWLDYKRYNSYDICIYGWYSWTGSGIRFNEPFEAYYPHSYDDSLDDIYDAHRNYSCPTWGATQ